MRVAQFGVMRASARTYIAETALRGELRSLNLVADTANADFFWRISAHVGDKSVEVAVRADSRYETASAADARECLYTVDMPRLEPGWYAFEARLECLERSIRHPRLSFAYAESDGLEQRVVLPVPTSAGMVRMVVLLTQPVTELGFDVGTQSKQIRSLGVRRLSRATVLSRLLARRDETWGRWLSRWIGFIAELARSGPAGAAATLYADHVWRLRAQCVGAHGESDGRASPPLGRRAFVRADRSCVKHDHWWAFPVCAYTEGFSGNARAVFESVRDDASIRKIILYCDEPVDLGGENVVAVSLYSRGGQRCLMHARQIFIKHGATRDLIYPLDPVLHNLINLWHGTPLKRIGHASLDQRHQLDVLASENAKCRAVIASSKNSARAMAEAFYPLSSHDVWPTGLPRNDFIVRDFAALPADLQAEGRMLGHVLAGRHLVLFAPTFRRFRAGGYYTFAPQELSTLQQWLARHNAVLGVREHMANRGGTYMQQLSAVGAIDLGDACFTDVEMLYRQADLLITDYSSCFFDFMLTGGPMVSFAYDRDHYSNRERGLFYDMESVFPGPICGDFSQLMNALEHALDGGTAPLVDAEYERKRRLFFDYFDDHNADRVVARVKQLYRSREPYGKEAESSW